MQCAHGHDALNVLEKFSATLFSNLMLTATKHPQTILCQLFCRTPDIFNCQRENIKNYWMRSIGFEELWRQRLVLSAEAEGWDHEVITNFWIWTITQAFQQGGVLTLTNCTNKDRGKSLIEEANIHIFVFCIINFFWNRLRLRSLNTNKRTSPPPPPKLSIFRGP